MAPADKATLEGLSRGMQAELAAYVFYKKSLEVTKDDKIQDILKDLARQEREHYFILERQYDNLARLETWNTITDILRQKGLPNLDERMEHIHEELIDEVNVSTKPLRILEIALILEERAFNLYSDLARKVENPKGKEMYEQLSKFEQGHVKKIQKMMEGYK